MSSVHALPVTTEPWLSTKQIAQHYGRSLTWVERHMRTGMPHHKDTPTSWPMFRLSEGGRLAALARKSREAAAD